MNHRILVLSAAAAAIATLAACGSLPERRVALERTHLRLNVVKADPQAMRHAGDELARAAAALQRADQAQADGSSAEEVDHLAYLAGQRVTIVEETAASRAAQAVTAGAGAERDRMLLALRTQEADTAQRALASAQQEGTRQSAELAAADRENAAGRARLAAADREAAAGQARLARSDARVDDLEQQLKALDARTTERGTVVTLGDMLFASGRSNLQASATASLSRLAEFMRGQPDRRAAIEGYTDSMGSEADNLMLSDRRAGAVKAALVGMGVGADRLSTQGHGERDPVAANDTALGRQSNRRVEIVFANDPVDAAPRR